MEDKKKMYSKNSIEKQTKYGIIILMFLLSSIFAFTGEAVLLAENFEEFILPDSDSRTYTVDSLITWMTSEDARIAKNEIYARHGRRFRDEELQAYFNSCSWYEGTIEPGSFDDSCLNSYEKANVGVLTELQEMLEEEEQEIEQAREEGAYIKDNMKDRSGSTCYSPQMIKEWVEENIADSTSNGFTLDEIRGEIVEVEDDSVLILVTCYLDGEWRDYDQYEIDRWTLTGSDALGNSIDVAPWNGEDISGGSFLSEPDDEAEWEEYEADEEDSLDDNSISDVPLEFTGKQAVHTVEIFDYWVACANDYSFSHLSDTDRVSMSLDLLMQELHSEQVIREEPYYGESVAYRSFIRDDAEIIMRNYFGSDFSPTDSDYEEAGYLLEPGRILFREGDWGMDTPVSTVVDSYMTAEEEYVYEMVYWLPEYGGNEGGTSFDDPWCKVTWYFKWDDNQAAYVISDMAYEINVDVESGTSDQYPSAERFSEEEFILPDSDERVYKKSELSGLSNEELRIARNEIYARRGRRFQDADLQRYFDACSWYEGVYSADEFEESWLNQYERANVATLAELEETAKPERKENRSNDNSDQIVKQEIYSDEEILEIAKRYYWDYLGKYYLTIDKEGSSEKIVQLHVYEKKSDHTATTAWLSVDRYTLEGKDFIGVNGSIWLLDGASADPGKFFFRNSAAEKLKESDLIGLSKKELRLARNEIYARRGRIFKDPELREYFEGCSWYNGTIDPEEFQEREEWMLDAFEKYNVDLILSVENGVEKTAEQKEGEGSDEKTELNRSSGKDEKEEMKKDSSPEVKNEVSKSESSQSGDEEKPVIEITPSIITENNPAANEYAQAGGEQRLYDYDIDGDYITLKYDDQGRVIEKIWYHEDGSFSLGYEFEFLENEHVISAVRFNEDGSDNSTMQFQCDEDWNILTAQKYKLNGDLVYNRIYYYNEKGNLESMERYSPNGLMTQRYLYDEYGNLLRHTFYDENGEETRYYEREFDEHQDLKRETKVHFGEKEYSFISMYDENHRRTEIVYYHGDDTLNYRLRFVPNQQDAQSAVLTIYAKDGSIESEVESDSLPKLPIPDKIK